MRRKLINGDYKTACHAVSVPMPGLPVFQRRVWKYDIHSSDLRKNPRDCFRLIGFLDNPDQEPAYMYGLFIYYKSDRSDVRPNEIADLANELKAALANR